MSSSEFCESLYLFEDDEVVSIIFHKMFYKKFDLIINDHLLYKKLLNNYFRIVNEILLLNLLVLP